MNDIKNKGFNVNDIKIDTIETLSGKDKSRRKELLDIIFLDSKN